MRGSRSVRRAGLVQPTGAQSKPRIVIVATGGTIAGAAESTTAAGYKSGAVAVDVLINAVPQMKKFADVRGVQVSSVGRQDMNDEIWIKLASEVNRLAAQSDVDGVAITHGTDTMVETASAIAAAGLSDRTVILTGAMVPYAFGSSDGLFNLGSALSFAQVLPPGVYVAMNGQYFAWDRVRKNREDGIFEATP